MIERTAGLGPLPDSEGGIPRVFLREPGWQVSLKVGSEKTFCFQVAPGEDFYHRLLDGELLIHRGDEKLCLPCAERRGLLTFTPRPLREQMAGIEIPADEDATGYDLKG